MSPRHDGVGKTRTPPTSPKKLHSYLQMVDVSAITMEDYEAEDAQTQTQSQSQFDFTQQSLDLTPDESSDLAPFGHTPPPPLPWGKLVPCVKTAQACVDLLPEKTEYWLGRSSTKSDVGIQAGVGVCKKEKLMMSWAYSMISNRHCRIYNVSSDSSSPQIMVENASGNGTWINQTTLLRKGEHRILHSGDEICLVNPMTLRKKLSSERVLQAVMQQYSFIFIQSANRKPCVNPRAMNYHYRHNDTGASSPRSARRIEAHYDLKEVLGDGTSGQVRRGIHRQTGKEYAIKIISLRRHMDTKSMEDEVNLLRSLDHPYIVQLMDVFVHPGVAMYLVMELVAGGDLFEQIVEQQRYAEVEARRLMRRLLSAIFYLHEHCNVVHRDLKPENILCSSPTDVKLADFGLAKIMKSDGLKTFCGTPQYFAPEVLERRHTAAGHGRYGKPADMWSLGVVLYILLTGRPPFGADIDTPQPYTIDFDDPIWQGMPLAQELVQQMLRLDPKRRINVRQACDHPWINVDDGDTHMHPLDDPNVTARKRLFSDSEMEKRRADDTASESASIDETNSVLSKESIMSKEDFAHAAVSHRRDDSVFQFSTEKLSDIQKISPIELKAPESPTTGDELPPMDISPVKNKDVMRMYGEALSTCHEEPDEDDHHLPSTSPEAAIAAESSVTPSECDEFSPSRSPLEVLNLNERTKRFRERVLREADDDGRSSPEPTNQVSEQSAVTPNISNVRHAPKEDDEASVSEDPILSQFSSAPPSPESYPAASNKKAKKRPLEETETSEDLSDAKRQNKQKRQTTLSSWFVSKKNAD